MILSMRKDRKRIAEALRAGVNAVLLRSGPVHRLLEAFEQTLDGSICVPHRSNQTRFSTPDLAPTDDPLEAERG
jgi:DNA-binding NarL/FixJ family response regulator